MFHGLRTRLAFAFAAAALVGTCLAPIASAFAAPLAPTQEHELASPKKPDVAVSIYDYSHDGPDDENVRLIYVIKNVGNAPSSAVPVKAECERDHIGSAMKHWVVLGTVLAPLAPGDSVYGEFKCYDGTGGRITVGSLNDSNTANNTSEFDWNF